LFTTGFKGEKIIFIGNLTTINQKQDKVGTTDLFPCTTNPLLLNRIFGVPDAGGIDEANGKIMQDQCLFDGIASGAGGLGDNGPRFTQKGIE